MEQNIVKDVVDEEDSRNVGLPSLTAYATS